MGIGGAAVSERNSTRQMMRRENVAVCYSSTFLGVSQKNDRKWVDAKYSLLTKREVKMAGYWPSSFFCVFVSVHNNVKKRTRPISSHLDRASLVNKGFIIWLCFQVKTTTTKHNRT